MTCSGRSPGSRVFAHLRLPRFCKRKTQWHVEEGLAADSCGRSSGFDLRLNEPQTAPDSLLTLINVISVPEHVHKGIKDRSLSMEKHPEFGWRRYIAISMWLINNRSHQPRSRRVINYIELVVQNSSV